MGPLELRLLGVVPIGLAPGSLGVGGALEAEIALGRHLGAGLEGAWLSDLTAVDPVVTARLRVHRQRLGAFGSYALGRGGPQWVTLAAGFEDQLFEAQATGYPHSNAAAENDPAVLARVGYAHVLVGRWFAFGEASARVVLVRQQFYAEDPSGATTVLTLPAASLEAGVGLGLRFF